MNKELRYYLSWLGYTPQEINEGIEYYNETHQITKIENENDFLAEIADGVVVALSKGGILTVIDANDKNTAEAPKAKAATKTKTKTNTKSKNAKK